MITERFGRVGFAALTFFMALMVVAVAPGAAATQDSVNWESDAAPQPEYEVSVTKSVHNMSWGQSSEAVRTYEDNEGDIKDLEGHVNTSKDNPYTFTYSNMDVADWSAFPRNAPDTSALQAAEWTTATSDSTNVAPSVADVETAPGVEALEISTTGMGSGDTATFTFSNFSVTSDEDKRYLQLVQDVKSLGSGAGVSYRVVDEDGDYKEAVIDQAASSGENLVATATGEGLVYQRQLGKASTQGSGDGTFDNIQKVEIVVSDADVTLEIAGLNVEKRSEYDLGTMKKNTDSDDELEDVDITERKTGGPVSIKSLGTLGSSFSSASIHDLSFPAIFSAEYAGQYDNDVKLNLTKDKSVDGGQYPGFKGTATVYVRMALPSAYDLSYSNAELLDTQSVTSDRLISVEYAEGVSHDTNFSDIDDAAWTDKTGSYTGDGNEISVDTTVQPGTPGVLKYTMKLTPSQYDAIGAVGGGGGGTGAMFGGSGPIALIVGIFTAGLAALKRLGGG